MAASYKEKLYIWGGCIQNMSKNKNNLMKDVYIFDHESNKWEKQTTEGEPPSNRFACAHANDLSRVYIFGGRGTDRKDR